MSVEGTIGPVPRGGTWAAVRHAVCGSRAARVCAGVIALFVAAALYGEAVYCWHRWRDQTPSYQRVHLDERYLPPSVLRRSRPTAESNTGTDQRPMGVRRLLYRPLGTDNLGRDVLQRLIQGARIAFLVGIITATIAIPIGTALGCLAGYFGGRVDDGIMWLNSTIAAIPGLLLVLAVAMVVGKGLTGVYLGIGLTTWVGLCRIVRAEVLKQREQGYVLAAKVLGYGSFRILFRHILPNVAHLALVTFSLRFPAAIGTEVFLSFLGIGAQGEPSWGVMLSNARLRLWQGAWWELTAVTLAIVLVVLAFNLLGDRLRDALDPRVS